MRHVISIILAVFFLPTFVWAEKSKMMKIPYQESKIYEGQTRFRCKPVLTASIWANKTNTNWSGNIDPIFEGELAKGTTVFFIKLSEDEQTLGVNSSTSIAYGFDDYKWNILANDEKNLIAIWVYPPARVETLTFNKENGIAVFTRNDEHYIVGGAPMGDVYYTLCE